MAPLRPLAGLSIEVPEGKIVTIIGANGAGKSSTLGAISGLVDYSGNISFDGATLERAPERVVRRGIIHVPEGGSIFPELTVEENLLAGAYSRRDRRPIQSDLEREYARFPALADRRRSAAANLSGGQQQMMVLARGMMARPRLLMLDEPSLGLAPVLVRQIMESIREINRERGVTVLLVEQSVNLALAMADYGYVFERGRVESARSDLPSPEEREYSTRLSRATECRQRLGSQTTAYFFLAMNQERDLEDGMTNDRTKTRAISTGDAPEPAGPFSQAIDTGTTVYVAGQLGLDLATGHVPTDIRQETELILKYISAILNEAGLRIDDVVRTTIYITDFADYAKINDVYRSYFSPPFPARATVQVSQLVGGARVEIDAVAVR